MKVIKMMYDYGCCPMWVRQSEDEIFEPMIAPELEDDLELNRLLLEIQETYENLFINNKSTFEYSGFKTKEEKQIYCDKYYYFMKRVKEKIGDIYKIIDLADPKDL